MTSTLSVLTQEENLASEEGRTYYVAPNGSDAHPGTRRQPWASPGYASRQLKPGDTLIILGGRYRLRNYDDVLIPPSGTAQAWITIRGERGNRPVLVGGNNLIAAIDLSGVEYVRIENLEITHDDTARGEAAWFRDGIEILGAPSAHIVLQDLYIHHVDEFGINIQDVEDLQILNTQIEYAGFGAIGGPAGEHGGWRSVVIRNASLSWSGHYYRGGDGSNRPYDRPDGLGVEASVGPILLENVVAAYNYGDGLDSKAANTIIRRAIVANNFCDGIKLWGSGSRIENTLIYGRGAGRPVPSPWAAIVIAPETQKNARFEIVNVTVDDFLGQNHLMHVQYDFPNVPAYVVVRNSIFSARGPRSSIYVAPNSTLDVDYNLFYFPQDEVIWIHGDQSYTCATLSGLGKGNLCGDPRFVRPAWGEEGDYHLQPGSPALRAGVFEGAPLDDLEGRLRAAPPTLGCYEH
ncbi:MAG: right-handed parallel beta-helix repeat-containing protein [Anaerolineales bacterium]|nr:right-handed parallel beta-helix repeat-containing protein [Anaerolineales bacterium]MDW8227441.1 right-handed parallel beta-helix repeat-containing protein [Anaerolineales bacterium]